METIIGKQLIYTRVEKEYSPTKSSGYQTFYFSDGLPASDVKFIEERIQGFGASNVEDVRFQYFFTPSNYAVMAQTRICQGHVEINDRYGRSIILGHCVILNRVDFEKIQNDPIYVFNNFTFISSPEEILNFSQQEQREMICRIEVQNDIRQQQDIASLDYLNLVAFIEQFSNSESSNHLLIYANSLDTLNVLETIMFFIPYRLRIFWSFDTNNQSLDARSLSSYMIIGTTSRRKVEGFVTLDHQTGKIEPAIQSPPTSSLYYRWLENNKGDVENILAQIPAIQNIVVAFKEKKEINFDDLNNEACQSFYLTNKDIIHNNILLALCKIVKREISIRWLSRFIDASSLTQRMNIAASQYIHPELMSFILRNLIKSQAPDFVGIATQDWKAILVFSQQYKDRVLAFWASGIMDDRNLTRNILGDLSPQDFREILALFDYPILPLLFVDTKHVDELNKFLQINISRISSEKIIDIVIRFCEIKQINALIQFVPWIYTLDNSNLSRLEKHLAKFEHLPLEFVTALRKRREQLGPSKSGFLGFINRK